MTPKTKQEALRLIGELKAKIDELPDEGRPVAEGWGRETGPGIMFVVRSGNHTWNKVAKITTNGLTPLSCCALDGIAHDDKGRIKVVGYVNAKELKERISEHVQFPGHYIRSIIDELAGR